MPNASCAARRRRRAAEPQGRDEEHTEPQLGLAPFLGRAPVCGTPMREKRRPPFRTQRPPRRAVPRAGTSRGTLRDTTMPTGPLRDQREPLSLQAEPTEPRVEPLSLQAEPTEPRVEPLCECVAPLCP